MVFFQPLLNGLGSSLCDSTFCNCGNKVKNFCACDQINKKVEPTQKGCKIIGKLGFAIIRARYRFTGHVPTRNSTTDDNLRQSLQSWGGGVSNTRKLSRRCVPVKHHLHHRYDMQTGTFGNDRTRLRFTAALLIGKQMITAGD